MDTKTNHRARAKKQQEKLRSEAWALLGKQCVFCESTEELHAAHVKPTSLNGAGRGGKRRWKDVIDHPDHYAPMCRECHRTFDRYVYELMRLARGAQVEEEIPF